MSNKLNKLVTNVPVTLTEQEVLNLSETLSAVRTAGGGGEGGHTYLGDGTYIGVDNNNNKISFLSDAAAKLESITDKLDKSDFEAVSADFATKTELESYATKTELENYQTKGDYLSANALNSLSGTWETVTDKLDKTEFAEVSGDFLTEASLNGYATETYVQTASAGITGWVNDQDYLKAVPDTYYLKTETSGKDELSAAFNDILKYNVTAAAGIEITTATDAGVKTFGISMTAEPVVTDTTLSGYSGIAAARDGEVNNQWNIGLTQDMLNTINEKLDSSDFTTYTGTTAPNTYLTKTSADTLYQPTGDYVTTADVLTGTSNTLIGIKIGSTDYTIPTTDLSNYYTKMQVDSTFASASQLNSYLTTAQYQTDSATFVTSSSNTITGTKQYALTTAGWAEVSTPTIPAITAENGISADGYKIGLTTTAINAITSVSSKVDKPSSLADKYLVLRTDSNGDVSGWCDFQDQSYSKSEALGTFVATADVGAGLYYSGSSPKLGVKLGTDLAFNTTTSAIQINTDGTAYGTHAFVEGTNTTASGNGAHAEGADAGAIGQGAHAGGYGTHTTGVGNFIHGTFLNFASPDGTTVSNTPVFVGGTLNATTAQDYTVHGGYLQIMGNGVYTGGGQGNNSDAYILYRDGTVKAKDFIAGGDTLSANYPVPKSVPNTGDNTMVAQKMFVCTSDADIVAHAALANGEGCIFFRVG